jgi:hypothetical protein
MVFAFEFARQAIVAQAFAGMGAQHLLDFPR